MNEKLQYAEMLEIPVNTCNITYKPPKKRKTQRKTVDGDKVKAELMDKINSEQVELKTEDLESPEEITEERLSEPQVESENQSITVSIKQVEKSTGKKAPKFGIIGIQLSVIGILLATIFLTNALFVDSGINVFFRSVFGTEVNATDEREYSDFAPVINLGNTPYALENGVITFAGAGSTYSPCDGTVISLSVGEDGKYAMEVAHSNNFKTLLSGLDLAYFKVGDMVKANIPVGYVLGENATICFYNGDSVITDFTIDQNSVVWAV